MANINIPELMDDELLISYICRIAEENAMPADRFAMHFIHDLPQGMDPNGSPISLSYGSTTFIPKLASVLGFQPLDLFMKTTLYPGTAPLILPGKQIRIVNSSFQNVHPYPRLIQDPHSDINLLRYCPVCAAEDAEKHGFSWLRRAHQMPGVNACWLHGVKLYKAVVNTRSSETYMEFPVLKAVPANHAEIAYAAFAGNFLNAGFDLNRVSSLQLIIRYKNNQNSWLSEIPQKERDLAMDEITEFRHIAKTLIGPSEETSILTQLFSTFYNVHNIPPYENIFIRDHFISQFSEYELVSGYHANGMALRKRHGSADFVTTAIGFLLGWRSPSENTLSETEKFNSIIDRLNELKSDAGLPPCEKTTNRLQQSIETNINALIKKTAARQIRGSNSTKSYRNLKNRNHTSISLFDFLKE